MVAKITVSKYLVCLFILFILSIATLQCSDSNTTKKFREPYDYGRIKINVTNVSYTSKYTIEVGIYPFAQMTNIDGKSNRSAYFQPEVTPVISVHDTNTIIIDSLDAGFYDVSLQYSASPDSALGGGRGQVLFRFSRPMVVFKIRVVSDSAAIVRVDGLTNDIAGSAIPVGEIPLIVFRPWKESIKGLDQ